MIFDGDTVIYEYQNEAVRRIDFTEFSLN